MDGLELIERAKARLHDDGQRTTDYQLAKVMGWQRARVSSLVRGLGHLTDREAVALARFAGVDEVFALVSVSAERARDKGSDVTPLWEAAVDRVLPEKSAA